MRTLKTPEDIIKEGGCDFTSSDMYFIKKLIATAQREALEAADEQLSEYKRKLKDAVLNAVLSNTKAGTHSALYFYEIADLIDTI